MIPGDSVIVSDSPVPKDRAFAVAYFKFLPGEVSPLSVAAFE